MPHEPAAGEQTSTKSRTPGPTPPATTRTPVAAYPKRPGSHFAHKFVRLMFFTRAAAEIGADAVLILVAIAHTEDAKRYSGPVAFYAPDLADQCGLSVSTMERARKRAVDAGWLHYERGAKRRPATHWVLIPDRHRDIPDGPTDDGDNFLRQADGELTEKRRRIDGEMGGEMTALLPSSSSFPFPSPNTSSPATPSVSASGGPAKEKRNKPKCDPKSDPRFAEFWEAYPRKVAKKAAATAFAKLAPSPDLFAAMLAAVAAWKLTDKWTSEGGQYIPYPATWLNGEQWEDELPKSTSGNRPPAANRTATGNQDF